jgi:pantetheine-phosphate adenylyltransferase
MSPTFVYAGSFDPPTYGHLAILTEAARCLPHITLVCSTNPNKLRRFTAQECVRLWHEYHLPRNVCVITLEQFTQNAIVPQDIILVRGIRDHTESQDEMNVLYYNLEHFGVSKGVYILSSESTCDISSSVVWETLLRHDIEVLGKMVAPGVITALFEKQFGYTICMVVGRPGSGKSTLLRHLVHGHPDTCHINTDTFTAILEPLLQKRFGSKQERRAILTAPKQAQELAEYLRPLWFSELRKSLIAVQGKNLVFIEVPYGLGTKKMYRFLGKHVLFVGCENEEQTKQRLAHRGTPEHQGLLSLIPDQAESQEIALSEKLHFHSIITRHKSRDVAHILRYAQQLKGEYR